MAIHRYNCHLNCSSFLRRLISEFAERNSTKIGQCHMLCKVSACPKSGVSPPLQFGGEKTHFWTTSQHNGNFNGLYLRNETRYRESIKCVDNYKGSPTSSQKVMNFGPQTASNSTCILPTLRKFCILLHFQALQTEISKRNSTKLCQTVDSKSR